MRWITSTHLDINSIGKEFEVILPELIKKLMLASHPSFPDFHVPIGDSIYKPGWDGTCKFDEQYEYIPRGVSLWEWGKDEDFLRKCNEEYKKRTSQTHESSRKESTFIFVTPKRWVKRSMSKNTKISVLKEKNEWKDIKIYDADDLETWIELHPAVGIWLAKELRLVPPRNIESPIDFWNTFINAKELIFSPELIIAGRDKEKSQIQHFLSGAPDNLEVQASSDTEAITFVIASAITKGQDFAEVFFSKAIIVKGKEELREIASNHENLIIIYSRPGNEAIDNLAPALNHIVNTLDFKIGTNDVSLPIPASDSFAKSLEALGLDWERAYSLSKQSGRSFSTLRRILTDIPGRFSWTENKDLKQLIPIFFLQKVDTSKSGDRQLIEALSQKQYEIYEEEIREWSLISDNPIRIISNQWRVVSPYDLFFAVSRYLTSSHIRLFEEAVLGSLGEIDPALDLDPNMRVASKLFEKEMNYSNQCKEGICQTLILISVFGEKAGLNIETSPSRWVDMVVRKLLANLELSFWQSIESKIHLLAEASPSEFLSALEGIIKNNPTSISTMFDDEGYDLFSPTYHTHILWALESLAWESNHFSRTVLLLADLVELDKGEKTSNRPLSSLRHIFLLWLPQTFVPQDIRSNALELLIKKKEDVAFKLLKEITPKHHDVGNYNHKSIWRNRSLTVQKISTKEWSKGISHVCDKIMELAKDRIDRWIEIIDLIDDFYLEDRTKLIDSLCSLRIPKNDEGLLFRDKLRRFIWHHENYSENDYAISGEDFKKLKDFYSNLVSGTVDQYYWYFNVDTIKSEKTSGLSISEQIKKTTELRRDALAKIIASSGLQGLLRLSDLVERPWLAGYNLSQVTDIYEKELIQLLVDDNGSHYPMAAGYVYGKSQISNLKWIKEKATSLKTMGNNRHLVNFFLSIEGNSEVWSLIKRTYPTLHTPYWNRIFRKEWFGNVQDKCLNDCIKELNSFKRYSTSLNLIRYDRQDTSTELIVETLSGFATNPTEQDTEISLGSWLIIELFKRLDKEDIEEETMQMLEWYYVSILNGSRQDRPIKHLYKALKEKPSFFAELISWTYLPETKSPQDEIKDLNMKFVQNRAQSARELLDSWADIPGRNNEGLIDQIELNAWIKETIDQCTKRDRKTKGYYELGKLFGKSKEVLTNWPTPEICEIIENIDEQKLEEGFVTGTINGSRVRVSMRPANGGSPDRARAIRYKQLSNEVSFKYPKVARLLMDVSKSYEHWADYMDNDKKQSNLD